ncbi:MAG: 1-acyl-sn-glycerol-3-phosphate acyltransferase [Deltaproteobacteria bacterium]|nr:1-acyl-sn-glycerol-3-phosphate acyltransferase [Deltaproteobacteria bacterium]
MERPPIFHFNEQRADLQRAVVDRVIAEARDPVFLLNDAAYHEIRRLEPAGKTDEALEWRKLARMLGGLDRARATEILRDKAMWYAKDVNGNFDRRVYAFASRVLPAGMSVFLRPNVVAERHPLEILRGDAMAERIVTSGAIAHIRKLAELGTVVYVPTHLSNLDSPVFAYALQAAGLPPVTYGAGVNLFTNPVLSFFMRNLGAYRVDRRLRFELYKQVLKTYSSILIERGFHSLFFPGGTRSRSGGVERKLKLGLAGTGLEAFVRTSAQGRPRKVFFVPATINYMLTLEAETLIDDWLQEQGRARYIIEDDESTRLDRMTVLARKLVQMDESCAVRFGTPLDPFGNEVDEHGVSHDHRGRPIDPLSYVVRDGKPALDHARDAQYTRELGEVVMQHYLRDTIAMPTHVVATAAFALLRRRMPSADLFSLVRRRDEIVLPWQDMHDEIERTQRRVAELERREDIVLSSAVRGATATELLNDAERALNGYHSHAILRSREQGVALLDPKVLLYYQNRLAAHGVAWEGGIAR